MKRTQATALSSCTHCMKRTITPKCNKCNSRDSRSPPARGTLVSVSVYERNLSPDTSTRYIKTWDVLMEFSYLKSLGPNESLSLKQLTLKTVALLTILAGWWIHTQYILSVIQMDQSLDKVIFDIIGLTKCSKLNQTKPTSCLQSMCGRWVTLSS